MLLWVSALEGSKYEIQEVFYMVCILWNISTFRSMISLHLRFPCLEIGMPALLQECPRNTIFILQSLFYSLSTSTCRIYAQNPAFVCALELAFY